MVPVYCRLMGGLAGRVKGTQLTLSAAHVVGCYCTVGLGITGKREKDILGETNSLRTSTFMNNHNDMMSKEKRKSAKPKSPVSTIFL